MSAAAQRRRDGTSQGAPRHPRPKTPAHAWSARTSDRANAPAVASRSPCPESILEGPAQSTGGAAGALGGLPASLRLSGRCTTPGDHPARKACSTPEHLSRQKRTPRVYPRTRDHWDQCPSPSHRAHAHKSGLRLVPLGDRQSNAMGPHHTAPHPSGSKDQAGLLRSPCSRSGGGRLVGVPRRSFHGDPLRSLLPDPCSGDACLSRWHQGLWP